MAMQSQCLQCVHFYGSFQKQEPSCAAFPTGIPKELWKGNFDHNNAYPGDREIRFSPVVTVEED